jgi:amino acid adenylation domain-containing protein
MNAIQSPTNRQAPTSSASIQRLPRSSRHFPLSFAQQRLWLFNELEPGNAVYNIPVAMRIVGKLNLIALQQTFTEVVRRHEVLRTRFADVDGEPVQIIDPPGQVTLPLVDLSGLAEDDQANLALRLADEEGLEPFDLAGGHPLRARWLRLNRDDHAILLTLHHIVYDGWSMGLLLREVSSLYDAFSQGLPSPLAELTIQYADFAVWQRSHLNDQIVERQLAYWQKQLAGFSLLELPVDCPRPRAQTFRGAVEECLWPVALQQALVELSRREGVSLFMTLLAAFQVLLSRYSGQTDIVVGSPIAGRTPREARQLIGCFLNTLSLRTDLSGNPSFRELLKRVRGVALGAYAHQDLPFERVVEALKPERSRSYAPIFHIMFTLDNTPAHPLQFAGLTAVPFGTGPATVGVDWDLTMMDRDPNGLRVLLQYATDLYDRDTIKRVLGNLHGLLESIVADPEKRLGELARLSEEEQEKLLANGNGTAVACAAPACVHELIAEQARRVPDRIAAAHGEHQLTYDELNRRANQLAHCLKETGVEAETRVAVCMERSPEMLISMLGIWKAGAAYVPLDVSYPPDRLAYVLEDVQARVVLASKGSQAILPADTPGVVLLDSGWQRIALQPAHEVQDKTTPANLAYVIYTSGSTGRPKGAMIEHRGMMNHLLAKVEDLKLTSDDVVAQTASAAFDISIWQFLAVLISGGTLQIISDGTVQDAAALLGQVEQAGVTVLETVPGMVAMMVDRQQQSSGRGRSGAALRWMISTGEALPAAVCAAWRAGFPDIPLLNAYGPTECSDDVTHYEVADALAEPLLYAPLGKPIRNLRLYVLDQNGEIAPMGVVGELVVGGIAVGRGYLNRPALTAEKFVPDPFTSEPGGLLYRTGDRVRWLNSGDLDYLGRIDEQVKIRGYRVELGEIEAVLDKHPGIVQNAVVACDDPLGGKRVVAYVVARRDAVNRLMLQEYLQERLPKYMVPSAFVLLEKLPQTPNGKVDRKALPVPDWHLGGKPHDLPRTPVEELLAGIWMEVLQLEALGVDDNFFDLGGHSLLATQVVSRIRSCMQVDLPLKALFESPTVAQLAGYLENRAREQKGKPLQFVVKEDREGLLPLSSAQQRLWFLDQLNPGDPAYNIHTALRIRGPLDPEVLERSLNEIVQRHAVLRTRLVTVDGQPMQEILSKATLHILVIDIGEIAEADRQNKARKLAAQEARLPFDLRSDLLLRATLARLGEQDHILMVTLHHIAGDGWSLGVLVREFTALYRAFSEGQVSPLTALQLQYADYALSQQKWLRGELLDEQLQYWKQQLGGDLPVLEFPTDRPRPAAQSTRGAAQPFKIPAHVTAQLRNLSRREGATLFMTLLAAFDVLLYRYTGEPDFAVGTDIANRNCLETEQLIGFFVNQLVLRADLSGRPTFRQLLSRVRKVTLDAYANQDVPFEKLVEELAPARNAGRTPLFQIKLILQNAPSALPDLPDLELSLLGVETETAKLDLIMNLIDEGDGIAGAIEYCTDLFDDGSIGSLIDHWLILVEAIAGNAEQRIDDLELLTPLERHQLLIEWNATETKHERSLCAPELIEEQAQRNPDAIAVADADNQLTYRELNQRSNQLAHYLHGIGVGPEVPVAVCLEKRLELVIGLLGVLKSGGAYVPLDAAYPMERLGYILDDTQAPVLLTSTALQQKLPAQWIHVVAIDGGWRDLAEQSRQNPRLPITENNLAYVIYTSGSTGQPKGTLVSHKGLTNYLRWAAQAYELASARAPLHTSLSFDLTITSLWGPLVSGGGVDLVPESQGIDGLRDTMAKSPRPAVVKLTPAHMQALTLGQIPDGVQALVIGGEALSCETVRPWRQQAKGVRLINEYGPTETVVGCCVHEITPHDGDQGNVPIGRPISNTTLYILDETMALLPIGAVGELYIGGAGVAHGYWQRPSLSAERFVPDPFSTVGERLYRTGDRARYRRDGVLECLGRTDDQVKVRGYRIETGEVEAALNQHPDVRASVVVAREDRPGDKQLIAYIALDSEAELAPDELQAFLQQKLPAYMIPAFYVFLSEFPLTTNGKIDRKALPSPLAAGLEMSLSGVAPRYLGEEIMAKIWRDVLGLPRIGVFDNFFNLGGHSLVAAQLVARVNDTFGIEAPISALFSNPTVDSFTRFVANQFAPDQFEETCEVLGEIERLSDAEVEEMILNMQDAI